MTRWLLGREEVGEVVRWAEGIERVHECIAVPASRPRRRLEYLKGLSVRARTGGRRSRQGTGVPSGVGHLVRDDLRDYDHLGDADGVLVVDEPGSAAVQRHGGTGRQIGVFLTLPRGGGLCTCLGCGPRQERREEAGVPARGPADAGTGGGVSPFGWVAGDTVYGNDRNLRRWLERRGSSRLAIKSNEKLCFDRQGAETGAGRPAGVWG